MLYRVQLNANSRCARIRIQLYPARNFALPLENLEKCERSEHFSSLYYLPGHRHLVSSDLSNEKHHFILLSSDALQRSVNY